MPPCDSSATIVDRVSTVLHPYGTLSLLSSPCLQGLSAAPQVRPSPLCSPLLSTVGASSYNQLLQDVDSAVAVSQAATPRAATGTAFNVFAALRDALSRGIVSRLLRHPTGGPRLPIHPVCCSPARWRGTPVAPPSS